jgi:putative membrane protein
MFAVAFFLLIATLAPEQASAHWSPGTLIDGPVWEYDPWLFGPLYASGVAFYLGSGNLWRSAGFGRGVRLAQATDFWVGWTSLALTVVSPLHWLGEHLFTAHMVEHGVVILVAAPLLAYSRPGAAFLWSAHRLAKGGRSASKLNACQGSVDKPPTSHLGHDAAGPRALGMAHAAALCVGAQGPGCASPGTPESVPDRFAVLVDAVPLARRVAEQRQQSAPAIGCLFLTMMQSGALGTILTFSPGLWYPDQKKWLLTSG